jgi:CyaY protein
MNDTQFLEESKALFASLEQRLANDDLDFFLTDYVFTIENDRREKIIINAHQPTQEIWLAAKSGAYHFQKDPIHHWFSVRDQASFNTIFEQKLLELA